MPDISNDITIKFEGEANQIEANTLINSLIHFTNITQEANRALENSEPVVINIKALAPGSFLIHIFFDANVISTIANIFTKENLSNAANLVTVVSGLFGLAKITKGQKPEVIEADQNGTKIVNNRGEITYIDNRVFNIYEKSATIRSAISQSFQTLNNDPKVTGFELLNDQGEPIVQISREEFQEIASAEQYQELPKERRQPKTGILHISSLSFEKGKKWNFVYEGVPFKANISDDFWQRVDNGESFSKGDSLEVEFEIKQKYDDKAGTYLNTSKGYKIIRVIRHIPRVRQSKLPFKK